MKGILGVSLLILLMPGAGDSADGKRLRDAKSLDALKKRLGDCSHMANKEFSAIETQNIIKYLKRSVLSIPLGLHRASAP